MKIGRLTLSDRASGGIYEDRSGPEIERVLRERCRDAEGKQSEQYLDTFHQDVMSFAARPARHRERRDRASDFQLWN